MLTIRPTTKAKRDIKKLARQNKDISKLHFILELLASGEKLPEKNRDHALTGNYVGHRGCHVEPDWILIYRIQENEMILVAVRTGSHSELFG